MEHFTSIRDFQDWRADEVGMLGFVPTLGALHEGHASLIQAAGQESDCVVVSIFVNPLQFDRAQDLAAYPSTLDADLELCEALGVDVVLTTSKDDMYPKGFATSVSVSGLDQSLCGAARPGHFAGVTTVVAKLFNIVEPVSAYFGEKDFQQLAIIKQMVRDLNMPLEIVAVPTRRDSEGLALSSRNTHLDPKQRQQAPALYRALKAARGRFEAGEESSKKLIQGAQEIIEAEIEGAKIDYLEIVDRESLAPQEAANQQSLMALAVFVGETRLIDNIAFGAA